MVLILAMAGVFSALTDWRLVVRSLNYPARPATTATWYQPRQVVAGAAPTVPPMPLHPHLKRMTTPFLPLCWSRWRPLRRRKTQWRYSFCIAIAWF